jgi:hypothetical protein
VYMPSSPAMALSRRTLPSLFPNYFLSRHMHLPFPRSVSEDRRALLGEVAGEHSKSLPRSLRLHKQDRSAWPPKSVICVTMPEIEVRLIYDLARRHERGLSQPAA